MTTTIGLDWYDSLSDTAKKLHDQIEESCPEFTHLDAEQCQEFMDELKSIGIETADAFKDAFFYSTDSANPFTEFTQYYVEEFCSKNMEAGVSYDWQATWNTVLKNHFDVIELGDTYFFQILNT